MSAYLVLILRGLMTICLYSFLVLALYFFLHEMRQTINQKESRQIPSIFLHVEGSKIKEFSQLEIIIGRDPGSDFQLDDEAISARHARIYFQGNHWLVEDTQSTNGTFINNERILISTALVENDIVRCGKIPIKISFETKQFE